MESSEAVNALAALAQQSRLEVFRLLVVAGERGLPAGEIAGKLGIPPATLTFHLKELNHAGLVESRREGRLIYYSLCVAQMRDLLAFLTEDCCQGRPDLCSLGPPQRCPPRSNPKTKKKARKK